jgi:hypothetical protein
MSSPFPKPATVAVCLFLPLLGAPRASAQLFLYGVKAGVPLTKFLDTPTSIYASSINRYAIGGTVEARLPWNLAIEIDGIYRHYGYSAGPYTADKTSTGDWEFPILAKYRFARGSVRPYADAGIAIGTLSGTTQTETLIMLWSQERPYTTTTSDPIELRRTTIAGWATGGGIDLRVRRLHIQPEVRFTRWNGRHFLNSGPPQSLLSNRNQAEFLLAIAF